MSLTRRGAATNFLARKDRSEAWFLLGQETSFSSMDLCFKFQIFELGENSFFFPSAPEGKIGLKHFEVTKRYRYISETKSHN